MKHLLRPSVPNVPFCNRGWRIPAVLLVVAYIITLAWGIHLWREGEASRGAQVRILGENVAERMGNLPEVVSQGAEAVGEAMPVAGWVSSGAQAVVEPSTVVNITGRSRVATGGQPAGEFVTVGSGVIVTPDGNVLTAWHLIKDLKEIRVRLHSSEGNRQYPAELLKKVPEQNLAMLKIQSRDLFPFVLMENVSALSPGERVNALSNPRGVGMMAAQGGVMGSGLTITLDGKPLNGLLRTDAVFLGDQTGGPLVNDNGKMIGLSLALQDGNGSILGYALPAGAILHQFADVTTFPKGVSPDPAPTEPTGSSSTASDGMPGNRPLADKWWQQARAMVQEITPNEGAVPGVAAGVPVWVPTAFSPSPGSLDSSDDGWHPLGYSMEKVAGLLLLGLISGISGGMMTMGGGIIKVSGLLLFFGYGMVLVRPVAYLTNIFLYGAASMRYHRHGLLRWEAVRPLVPWAMAGMVIGFVAGNFMGNDLIRILLGVFALLVGLKMLAEIIEQQRTGRVLDDLEMQEQDDVTELFLRYLGVRDLPEKHRLHAKHPLMENGLLGLPLGIISGILGITGGVVEVPLQRYVAGTPLRNAIANSAVLVFFASLVGSVVALTYGLMSGAFDWKTPLALSLFVIPGAYAGGWIGAWLTQVVPAMVLRVTYVVLMIMIAARMFWE